MRLLLRAACAFAAVALVGVPAAGSATSATPSPQAWVQSVPQARFANLLLVAGLTKERGGFNFNGYSNGKLKVIVPLNWTVHVVLLNEQQGVAHSAMIVSSSTKSERGARPVFPDATTPLPAVGTKPGGVAGFTFRARKAGTYHVICAVPGHFEGGMWDTLIVQKGIKEASAST